MPISHAAARDAARNIIAAFDPEPSEIEVSLAASLIVKAVERDELALTSQVIGKEGTV